MLAILYVMCILNLLFQKGFIWTIPDHLNGLKIEEHKNLKYYNVSNNNLSIIVEKPVQAMWRKNTSAGSLGVAYQWWLSGCGAYGYIYP